MARILVVENNATTRRFLERTLTRDGHQVTSVESGDVLPELEYDLAIISLESGKAGAELSRRWPFTPIVVLTTPAALGRALDAMGGVATDYLYQPCQALELRASVHAALLARERRLQRWLLDRLAYDLSNALEAMRKVTPSPAPTAVDGPGDAHRAE